jgi:hypothetical protein
MTTPTFSTFPLPLPEDRWPEVRRVAETFLRAHCAGPLEVMLGWAVMDHPEADEGSFQPRPTTLEALPAVMQDYLDHGFSFGEHDLFLIVEGDRPFSIQYCHEGDLHFASDDADLTDSFRAALADIGVDLRAMRSPTPESSGQVS